MGTSTKVVIITGAGSGIGKASALRFSEAGYKVFVSDLNEESAVKTCQFIKEMGGEAKPQVTDVSDLGSCQSMAQAAFSAWGRVDALVANAGIQLGGSLLETEESDWDKIINVNLKGVAFSCKTVLPLMRESSEGSIVITSSVNAVRGKPGMAIYDMTKASVLGLMRNLAVEYGGEGIRVNAVCPGDTLTEFHIDKMKSQGITFEQIQEMTAGYALLGRAGKPSEIANAIHFLASDEASFITGQAICVDGGFTVTGGGQ